MEIKVCIGSSCHIKGSRQVVDILQKRIREAGLDDKVNLSGTFCMGNCKNGVCVTVDGREYVLTPETTDAFFDENIAGKAENV